MDYKDHVILWQQLELTSESESDLQDTVGWCRKWLVHFIAGKTQLVSFECSKTTGAIDVKMDWSFLVEKSSFKMLGLTFSSTLDWGSYIISIVKSVSKKIGGLLLAANCYLELLNKLQKWICRTVGPSLAASLEPLVHRQNEASLSLFYRY